jgi:RND family efflux transporter MFP subunit
MRRHIPMNHLARAAIAGVAVFSMACSKTGDKEGDTPEAKPTVGANTIVVVPQAFTETLGSIGNVVGRSGHVATLSAPIAGRIGEVLVTTGQAVQKDQVLVRMDQAPFEQAVQAAEAALQAAERANERQQRLAQEGIVPRKDAEQAAAEFAKARADAQAARRMEQLSVLRSPIAGVVTRMLATIGASADPSQPLVEISDPTALDVIMNVTPTDAARVRPGAKVTLSAGQSANGEPLGVGSVVDISGTVDSTNRGVAVRVQAPTTRRPLRIGETVFGDIAIATVPNAIVLPLEALVPEGENFTVFVVDPNGIAHSREVKIGGKTATSVEITDGVKAGDRVVTTGAYGVTDSAKVVQLKPAVPTTP